MVPLQDQNEPSISRKPRCKYGHRRTIEIPQRARILRLIVV